MPPQCVYGTHRLSLSHFPWGRGGGGSEGEDGHSEIFVRITGSAASIILYNKRYSNFKKSYARNPVDIGIAQSPRRHLSEAAV